MRHFEKPRFLYSVLYRFGETLNWDCNMDGRMTLHTYVYHFVVILFNLSCEVDDRANEAIQNASFQNGDIYKAVVSGLGHASFFFNG